jgi:ketosteroid isomerase-like protein
MSQENVEIVRSIYRAVERGDYSARGKASGLEVDRLSGWVATFRDGRVLRFEIFLDPVEALEAVGLRE